LWLSDWKENWNDQSGLNFGWELQNFYNFVEEALGLFVSFSYLISAQELSSSRIANKSGACGNHKANVTQRKSNVPVGVDLAAANVSVGYVLKIKNSC
jgi:hypothetical protein